MREHWPRWIYASLSKHFVTTLNTAGLTGFIEGTDRDTKALGEEHYEFRMDGPRLRQTHKTEYRVWVAINILFKSSMNDQNFHRKHVMAGLIEDAFLSAIPVFKLGDGPDDDQSLLGCFIFDAERVNGIQINHFGQIEETIRVEQGTVEGHYVAYLNDN